METPNNLRKKLILGLISVFALIACHKTHTATPVKHTLDVYVAGYTTFANYKPTATYWKNGVPVLLSDSTTNTSTATCIYVQGTDVYVAGNISSLSQEISHACYWKNGVINMLTTDSASVANGIVVNGNDIYVTGSVTKGAFYWHNGTLTKLSNQFSATGVGISLQGSDVYIAGHTTGATYWKNNIPVVLDSDPNSLGIAIAVKGGTVYTAGQATSNVFPIPIYWKDRQAIGFGAATKNGGSANDIIIKGNDVYVTGNNGTPAYYWKNNIPTILTDSSRNVFANSIAVNGSDVYVGGYSIDQNHSVVKYWKNGTAVSLSGKQGTHPQAFSIFVVSN